MLVSVTQTRIGANVDERLRSTCRCNRLQLAGSSLGVTWAIPDQVSNFSRLLGLHLLARLLKLSCRVLGGGGGAEGFKHHLAHVGKAAQEWAKDMAANAYVPTEETNGKLAKEVDEQLAGLGNGGVEKLPSERDEFLVGLLKLKQQLAASARV